MSAADAHELLRADLLAGRRIAIAGRASTAAPIGAAASAALLALGARVAVVELGACDDPAQAETDAREAFAAALEALGGCDALIVDGEGLFGGEGGAAALLAGPAACWNAARAAAELAFLPRGPAIDGPESEGEGAAAGEDGGGGRILLVAPGRGEHAAAASAALENLARTLSIEWARHGITTVALAPGRETALEEIATLLAYLCSPAGDYFSGCLLALRGPAGAHASP